MEGGATAAAAAAEYGSKILRKRHVTTRYSAVGDDGRTCTLTKRTSSASYEVDSSRRELTPDGGACGDGRSGVGGDGNSNVDGDGSSNVDDESKLRSRGIRIVDADAPRFQKVSPEQVADYYKSLGDWQNVLPKTDYAYSPVSRFYRKAINGVIPVIPNMSRREIRRSPEELDNEINLFCAKNYLYEESSCAAADRSAWSTTTTAMDGGDRLAHRYRAAGNSVLSMPSKRGAVDYDDVANSYSNTRLSAKLSRLRLHSVDDSDDDYGSDRHLGYVSSASSSSSAYSLWTGATLLVSSVIGALYSLSHYTYAKVVRRFVDRSTSSSSTTETTWLSRSRAKSRSTAGGVACASPFWKWFLLVLLLLLLCASVANVSGGGGGHSDVSAITAPVSKSCSFLTRLVLSTWELTYSSVAFVASAISMAGSKLGGGDGGDGANGAFAALPTSLYHLVTLPLGWLWPSAEQHHRQHHAHPSAGSAANMEQQFERWLATVSTDELARKIVASDEFARFVDARLMASAQQRDADRMAEALARGRDAPLALEKRVAELEAKFAQLETTQGEAAQDFERKLATLRVEIVEREQRLEQEVIATLTAVMGGGGDDAAANVAELRARFAALFATAESAWRRIELVELQFSKFERNSSAAFEAHVERTSRELEHNLRFSVEELVARKLAEWRASSSVAGDAADAAGDADLPPRDEQASRDADRLEAYVKGVVRQALQVYDADKTGRADYALESSGGIVLSTRCTESKTANIQFSLFGVPLWHMSRSPRTAIQPSVHPGECWAFRGSNGYLVLQLSERIYVTGVTLEHIARSLAPNGTIDSAPKDFSVWALRSEADAEPQPLGKFRFEADGPSLQYFETRRLPDAYQIVELKVLSNHGKLDYTCVYRFRVHGVPV